MASRYRLTDVIWLVLYVSLLAAVIGGLVYARSRVMAAYDTDQARSEWEQWREDAKEQAEGKGPVARRVPKSAEPPALVLMRDYFAVCVVIAVGLSSILFGTFVFLLRGVLATTPFVDRSPPEPRADGTHAPLAPRSARGQPTDPRSRRWFGTVRRTPGSPSSA